MIQQKKKKQPVRKESHTNGVVDAVKLVGLDVIIQPPLNANNVGEVKSLAMVRSIQTSKMKHL